MGPRHALYLDNIIHPTNVARRGFVSTEVCPYCYHGLWYMVYYFFPKWNRVYSRPKSWLWSGNIHWYVIFSCDQAALCMVLSVRPSICLSVCPSHLFDYVTVIVSWNFQKLSPRTRVRSMQEVKVRGQRSRSQRSQSNLAVSGLLFQFEFTYDDEMMHEKWPFVF